MSPAEWARWGLSRHVLSIPALVAAVLLIACTASRISAPKGSPGLNTWTSHGPPGGYISALAIDPANPQIVLAGTLVPGSGSGAGVFKSADGGRTWNSASDGLTSGGIIGLNADPTNPQIIYANIYDHGVFKTTDGAASWSSANWMLPRNPQTFAIDPIDPRIIYAAVGRRVFKTTDGGASWSAAGAGLPRRATVLLIDPSDDGVVYAGARRRLYKTTDGGASWGEILRQHISTLAEDPVHPKVLYVGTESHGVLESTDGGRSWARLAGLPQNAVQAIAIDHTSTNVFYVAENLKGGLFKTTDGGKSWSQITRGLNRVDVVATLAIAPNDPRIIYAGTYVDGVFRTTDGGREWTMATTGLAGQGAGSLAIDPTDPEVLYAGGGRVFKTTDGGATWSRGTGRGGALAIDPRDPKIVYSGTCGTVFKSTNGGQTWEPTGLANACISYSLVIDPDHTRTLYAGAQSFTYHCCGQRSGVYKTTNGGRSWRRVLRRPVVGLVINPTDPRILYANGYAKVLKTTNGGRSWRSANAGLRGTGWALVMDPSDPRVLYVGTEFDGLFKTSDGGASWNAVGGRPLSGLFALVIDPTDPRVLYAGTSQGGVFRSSDGGASWEEMNNGLLSKDVSVQALAIDPTGTFLHVGTASGEWDIRVRG